MKNSIEGHNAESKFLDAVSATYVTSVSPQDRLIRQLVVKTFAPFMSPGKRALELGCSDGYMTALIARQVAHLDVVDGSRSFIEKAHKKGIENATFIHSLFEEYRPKMHYDYIFATYILEHVNDVHQLLHTMKSSLAPEGLIFIVVPNARALSRQLALHMGLIEDLKSLTENDLHHGHRRVYDRVALNRDTAKGGLVTISQGGILLKPLADFQMDKLIETEVLGASQIDGLYSLGHEYPDLCGSLFSVCRPA